MTEPAYKTTPGTVYFVGAGPGAPDLITVRGKDIIAQADLILYADSLVEESVAQLARKPEARFETSSNRHLEQILALMADTARAGGVVARIHSGDPALYGAIHEQMAWLEDYQIPYEIVPGVTAAFAAAAQLKTELTVPDVVQTIILTRTAGRTTMPAGEDLQTLAAPGASLAIYLSVTRIRQVVDDLLAGGGYGPDTPVAVHHKVTWPDESYVTGTLADIVEKVKQAGYTKHALILVSPALEPSLKGKNRRTSSHLYDKSYTHRFRRAEDFKRGKEQREARGGVKNVVIGEKHLGGRAARRGSVVVAITKRGSELATKLADEFGAELAIPVKFVSEAPSPQPSPGERGSFSSPSEDGIESRLSTSRPTPPTPYSDSALAEIRRRWAKHQQLILVMPTGVAVRAVAPLLGNKSTDPAVVCLDEAGKSVIPLLGGHRAGANALAQQIAAFTAGHAAITTASDVQGKPALDQLGKAAGWKIDPASATTYVTACLVNDDAVGVYIDPALADIRQKATAWLTQAGNLTLVDHLDDLDLDAYAAGLIITHQCLSDHHLHLLSKSILYHPPVLVVGVGCKRGVPAQELRQAVESTLAEAQLAADSIVKLASVDIKADELGLQELAYELDIPFQLVEQAKLMSLESSQFSPSAAQEKFNLPGVAEPCALLTAGSDGRLLVAKQSFDRCTVAVAIAGAEL